LLNGERGERREEPIGEMRDEVDDTPSPEEMSEGDWEESSEVEGRWCLV
jgi:hypothetical protein